MGNLDGDRRGREPCLARPATGPRGEEWLASAKLLRRRPPLIHPALVGASSIPRMKGAARFRDVQKQGK
jgi:hypothetical protein